MTSSNDSISRNIEKKEKVLKILFVFNNFLGRFGRRKGSPAVTIVTTHVRTVCATNLRK